MQKINLFWFKKDLRTYDNEALYEALKTENVIPIFVVEPDLWKLPDHSSRQWEFVRECLIDLNNSLSDIGLKLIIRVGNIQDVIKADFAEAGDEDVYRKLYGDLKDKNISEDQIRKKMQECNEKATTEVS
mgnify:CR=1 FL=1